MRQRRPFWIMVAILLLLGAVGMRGLDIDALWADELFSIRDAGGSIFTPRSLASVWKVVATGNPNHTPGYFMLLNLWEHVVGYEPPALRALSVFAGLLTVAWTYRLGRDLVSARVGVYGAALLASSAFFIHYVYELRMYAFVTLWTAYTFWAYFHVLRHRGQPHRLDWLGLFAGTLCLLYTHYFAAMALIALGIYHLIAAPKNRRWLQIAGAMGLAGALYLPWLPIMLGNLNESDTLGAARLPDQIVLDLVYFFSNGLGLLLLLLGAAAVTATGKAARRVQILTGIFLLTILTVDSISHIMREYNMRYILGVWPALAVFAGLGLTRLETITRGSAVLRYAAPALALVWMGVGVVSNVTDRIPGAMIGTEHWFPMHRVERTIRSLRQPDDMVFVYLPDNHSTFRYRTSRQIAEFYFRETPNDYALTTTGFYRGQEAEEEASRKERAAERQRIWVAYDPSAESASQPVFDRWLQDEAGFFRCEPALNEPGLRLDQFARAPVCCLPAPATTRIQFEPGIDVVAAEVTRPDDATARVAVLWRVNGDVPLHTYSASLQVLDANGLKVGQADYGLPAMTLPCGVTDIAVPDAQPGEYTVAVGVYPWQTGERVQGRDVTTGQTGDLLPLVQVTIDG